MDHKVTGDNVASAQIPVKELRPLCGALRASLTGLLASAGWHLEGAELPYFFTDGKMGHFNLKKGPYGSN